MKLAWLIPVCLLLVATTWFAVALRAGLIAQEKAVPEANEGPANRENVPSPQTVAAETKNGKENSESALPREKLTLAANEGQANPEPAPARPKALAEGNEGNTDPEPVPAPERAVPQVNEAKEQPEAAPAPEDRRVLLQTVGLLAASQVYQAYLNVGFLADGKASGSYQAKDCQQVMEIVFNLLEASDQQLDKIGKLELSQDDREAINTIRKLSGLVRQQGDELHAFWQTGSQENLTRYGQLRQQAWQGINALLKLDKK